MVSELPAPSQIGDPAPRHHDQEEAVRATADERGPVHHLEVDRGSDLLSVVLKGERHNFIGNPSAAC